MRRVSLVSILLVTLTAAGAPQSFAMNPPMAPCLRPLSHHGLGRHSVASQTVTNGHPIKAVQAQLGHRSEQSTHLYAHLGSHAQLRLVESLQPVAPPHVNVRSTSKKKGT